MSSQDSPSPTPDSTPSYVEIGTDSHKAEGFLDRNFKLILVLALALLLGLFGYIIWQWMNEQAKSRAASALSLAADREELRTVSQDHAGTPAGGSALLELAAQLHAEGELAEAKNIWQQFLNDYQSHPLRSQAILALAAAQRSEGDLDAAAQTLQGLPEENSASLQVIAAIQAGDKYWEQGEIEPAIDRWTQALDGDAADSAYLRSLIDQRIRLARAGTPTVVAELPAKSESEVEREQREAQQNQAESDQIGSASLDLSEFGLEADPSAPETDTSESAITADSLGFPLAPSSDESPEDPIAPVNPVEEIDKTVETAEEATAEEMREDEAIEESEATEETFE